MTNVTWMRPVVSLGELVRDAQSGFASGERAADGVVQLRMNNVTTDGTLDWGNVLRVPASRREIDKYRLRAGDVLFNSTNSPELVGKTALFRGYPEPVVFSNHFVRLRVDEAQADPRFVASWLVAQRNAGVFQGLCTQWVNQAAVRKEDLLLLGIPLPSLPEQRRIAAILERADRLRRLRRYALELSEGYLQAVFVEMFGDPVRNPKGWDWATVKDVSLKVTDGEHITPQRTETGIKLLSARNIQNGFIDFSAGLDYIPEHEYRRIKRRCNPGRGDLLMSCSGTVGRVTTVDIDEPFSMVRSVALIKPDPTKVKPKYLEHFLRSEYGQRQIKQSAKASSQANIFNEPIRKLPVVVPPLSDQETFTRVVRQYERLRAQQREAARQAEQLFGALLDRAFRGEL